MKKGKISQSVLKRSVLKFVQQNHTEILKGAGPGEDCTFLMKKNQPMGVSTQTVALPAWDAASCVVIAAVNNLAAAGVLARSITLALTLPEKCEEQELQRMMKQIADTCKELGLEIAGGHTEVSNYVNTPVITVTALGYPFTEGGDILPADRKAGDKMGLDIVMTKWIGMEGTFLLAREKEKELLTRYPLSMLRTAQKFDRCLSVIPEAEIATKLGVFTMHDVRNGGVFGGLYELAKRMNVGVSVDLKQIPVKQETIEICEFFDLNPYELLAGGSLLLATQDGAALTEALHQEGIAASVIGKTTDDNNKVVRNGEETRFLEPAGMDELFKVSFS